MDINSTPNPQTQGQAAAPQEASVAPVEPSAQELTGAEVPLDQRPTKIGITIPTHAYFLSGIRDFILNVTQNVTGFSEKWAYRFQAVVDELCNNAIEHGSAPGHEVQITIIGYHGEALEVIVEDSGTGQQKMTAEQMRALYQERVNLFATQQYMGIRGRGLPKIVGEWTDEIVFEDREGGGLRVKVKKYLRKEEDAVSSAQQNDPTHLVIS